MKNDLLTIPEFLKEANKKGIDISRRTLQYWSSPQWKLMPKPIHKGKNRAYLPRKLITRLLIIFIYKQLNYTLKEIKKVNFNIENSDDLKKLSKIYIQYLKNSEKKHKELVAKYEGLLSLNQG